MPNHEFHPSPPDPVDFADPSTPGLPATRKMISVFFLLSCLVFAFYVYHNPIRWEAYTHNAWAFLLILRPYTWYGHWPEILMTVWLWLLGLGLGVGLLRGFRPAAHPICVFEAVALGWAVLSFLTLVLALLQWLHLYVLTAVLLMLSLPAAYCLVVDRAVVGISYKFRFDNRLRGSGDVFFTRILIGVAIAFAFFSSLMPPTQSDGLRYHLTVPNLYLRHGGFFLLPDIAFSNFPFLIEYLYSIPLAFGIVSGPKLLHFSYFCILLGLVSRMGKKLGGEKSGLYGVLLVSTTPFVPIFASWSFIEFGLTAYTVLGFVYALEAAEAAGEGRDTAAWKYALLTGVAGGLAVSCKYTALATLAGLLATVFDAPGFVRRRDLWPRLRRVMGAGLVAGLIASPWLIKNWVLLGNPLYPFAANWFPTPNWTPFNGLFFAYHAGLKGNLTAVMQSPLGQKILDLFTLPLRVTFFPGDVGQPEDFGTWPIGSIWLILGLLLLFRRQWNRREGLHVCFAVFLFLVWAYTYRDTRFLLPAMAAGAPLLAKIVAEMIACWRPVYGGLLVLVVYSMLHTGFLLLIPRTYAPWWVVSGTVSEEDYLSRESDFTRYECQAFAFLKEHARPDDTVLLHGIEQTFYCPNPYIGADWFNTDPLIRWSVQSPRVEGLLREMRDRKIRYFVYNYGRIKQYEPFYRLFRLPEETGHALLKEYVSKEGTRLLYPLAYEDWLARFQQNLLRAEAQAPNLPALGRLLQGEGLREVFRYDEKAEDPREGIVVYEIPEEEIKAP